MAGPITMEELMRTFGRPMAPAQNVQQAPVGLLAAPQQAQPAQAKPRGLFGFLADPDARARLAIALEGMTMNPNQAYMQALQEGVTTRRETKAATEAKNKTAEWLRSQGRDDLATAVEGGIIGGSDAFAAMSQKADAVKGVEVGNSLVNPVTGEVMYSAPTEMKPGFRIATPEEAKAYGAAGGQFGPDGRFYPADAGGMVVYGADGQPIVSTGGAKPFTEGQSKDVGFATRARGALEILDPVDTELTSRLSRAAEYDPTGFARGAVQSDNFQIAKNAGDEFLMALLRKDTGAAITEGEQALYGRLYLPGPGDNAALIEAKRAARQRAVAGIEAGMSPAQIAAQEMAMGKGEPPAPTGTSKSGGVRLKFNAETGAFE
jgi:hypothetical protein